MSISQELLKDDVDDYSFFPIKRDGLLKHYYDQRHHRWTPTDIDLTLDRTDYDNCNPKIQHFIKGILSFFVFADGLVVENIFENFQRDTSFWKEPRAFYAEQNAMEVVHGEMYSLMAQTLIRDASELHNIFNSIKTSKCVQKIRQFMEKYMNRTYTLPERILAFACIEGILFNSAFASVYWLKKKNILRGFCKANEFIARDEGIHTQFAVTLLLWITQRKEYINCLSAEKVKEIINEAVEVNIQFIKDILPVGLIGLSEDDLISYTKCTADALSVSIGYNKIYNVANPFDWMVVISLPNKTNFFEDKVSEYTQLITGDFVFDENAYF